MYRVIHSIVICGLFAIASVYSQATEMRGEIHGPAEVFAFAAEFAEVRDSLVFAIEDQGLVISYISHANDMLVRTADAVGTPTTVYADAEIVLFCKSGLSHDLAAHNPHNLVLCPYPIAVYSLAKDPHTTYLGILLYEDEPMYQELRDFLAGIVEQVKQDL